MPGVPPIYVINRAPDADRLAGFAQAAAAQKVDLTRLPAWDAEDPATPFFLHAGLARGGFWGGETIKPGAFACYLSHRDAWARLKGEGHEAALICEDDARLGPGLRPVWKALDGRDDWDLVFVNSRLADWLRAAGIEGDEPVVDAGAMLNALDRSWAAPGEGGLSRGPGADAYVLTARGARALLDLTAARGIVAGVDWTMLAAGMGEAAPDWAEARFLAAFDGPALRVGVAREAAATLAPGPSVIVHAREVPGADFPPGPDFETGPRFPKGPGQDPVCAALAAGRWPEAPALDLLRRWTPEGGLFVDIGAHVGAHTLFMLHHGPAARAIPFESNPRAVKLLREAVVMNGLEDRVDLSHLGFGLSDQRGKAEAFGPKRDYAAQRLREGFVETVNLRPGDALLREDAPAMIKIDVNGEERDVLKGLRRTLKRHAPMLGLDLTRPKSRKTGPLLERLGYVEAERADWEEDGAEKRFAVYRPA